MGKQPEPRATMETRRQEAMELLSHQGFRRIEPGDGQGVDFLAFHGNGERAVGIRLETRACIRVDHIGRDLWVMFPAGVGWYLVPHDVLVTAFAKETVRGKSLESRSWLEDGTCTFPMLPRKMRIRLGKYLLADATEGVRDGSELP